MKNRGNIEQLLARNQAVYRFCLRSARKELLYGRLEASAQWCSIAASLAAEDGWYGCLADDEIEDLLIKISARIEPKPPSNSNNYHPKRWLHVLTEAWFWGGMIENIKKWIRFTHHDVVNNIVVMSQNNIDWLMGVKGLLEQVTGQLFIIDRSKPLIEKASELRFLAIEHSDVVVLHVRVSDIIPALAFGVAGGPVVIRMNHDDHMFWPGVCSTDLLINFRDLGMQWTQLHRGINRTFLLPLPLERYNSCPNIHDQASHFADCMSDSRMLTGGEMCIRKNGSNVNYSKKEYLRKILDIPVNGIVLLTSGSPYKFNPTGKWDFMAAATAILERCSSAYIIALGLSNEGRWKSLAESSEGRFRALGIVSNVDDYLTIADIGLGSIPFPSQTAILEIGQRGCPCVLTPSEIPFGINDPAFDDFPIPVTIEDYVNLAVNWINDPILRQSDGFRLARSIIKYHERDGWLLRWTMLHDRIRRIAPHRLYPIEPFEAMTEPACKFWVEFKRLDSCDPIAFVHYNIITQDWKLRPQPDRKLTDDMKYGQFKALILKTLFEWRMIRFQAGWGYKVCLEKCKSLYNKIKM